MPDREAILARAREAVAHAVPHPGRYPAPDGGDGDWASFAERLRSVGGEPYGPVAAADLDATLERLCGAWAVLRRVVMSQALADRAVTTRFPVVSEQTAPHSLADVEVALLAGVLGVAENGAVAVPGPEARPRALPFLCQRLVLVLDAGAIVPDMHAAVARMGPDALAHHHYTWISGPSKTADIEQTVVLGAHGPKALAVVAVEGWASG